MSRTVLHVSDVEGVLTPFLLTNQVYVSRGVESVEVHVDRAGGSVDVYVYKRDEPPAQIGCYKPCDCP